jgi:hypothetical protein
MPETLPFSAMTRFGCSQWRMMTPFGGEILLELGSVHVLLAAPVADGHLFGAEQLGLHGGVDRRHAAADDDDAPTDRQFGEVGRLAQFGDEIDGVGDARSILAFARSALTPPSPMPRNTAS